MPGLRNVCVYVEPGLLEDVRRQATERFPDGGEFACYYPRDKKLVFGVRHAGRGLFTNAREVLPATADQTIGMVVDVLTKDPDWTDIFLTSPCQPVHPSKDLTGDVPRSAVTTMKAPTTSTNTKVTTSFEFVT